MGDGGVGKVAWLSISSLWPAVCPFETAAFEVDASPWRSKLKSGTQITKMVKKPNCQGFHCNNSKGYGLTPRM